MPRLTLSRMEAESGSLPSLCMCCGVPANTTDSKKFAWHPLWVWLLLPAGLLPMAIVAMCLTKRMTVRGPFCQQHRRHWTFRNWLIGGSLVLLIAVGFVAVIFAAANIIPKEGMGWVCGSTLFAAFVWLIGAVALQVTSIGAREITDRHITLGLVSERFIQAMEQQRSSQQVMYAQPYFQQSSAGANPHVAQPGDVQGVPGMQSFRTDSWGQQDFRKPTSGMSGGMIAIIVLAVLGVVCVGCLGVISTVGQKANSTFVPVGTALSSTSGLPVVDRGNHFQLNSPGRAWILVTPAEARKNNNLAAAAAELPGKDIYCSVLIETATPDTEVEDREKEFADQMIKFGNNSLNNKRVEKITPLTFRGQKAVRYRYTGTNAQGLRLLVDVTAFVYMGKLYRLHCAGALSDVRIDGSTFEPFLDAFLLLPGY